MAGMANAKSSFGRQTKKKSSSSKKGVISSSKAKKMHDALVEYEEPFEKKGELYKEGKGTERWSSKPGGAKKGPKSGVSAKKGMSRKKKGK